MYFLLELTYYCECDHQSFGLKFSQLMESGDPELYLRIRYLYTHLLFSPQGVSAINMTVKHERNLSVTTYVTRDTQMQTKGILHLNSSQKANDKYIR